MKIEGYLKAALRTIPMPTRRVVILSASIFTFTLLIHRIAQSPLSLPPVWRWLARLAYSLISRRPLNTAGLSSRTITTRRIPTEIRNAPPSSSGSPSGALTIGSSRVPLPESSIAPTRPASSEADASGSDADHSSARESSGNPSSAFSRPPSRARPSSEAPTRRAPSRVDASGSDADHSSARESSGSPSSAFSRPPTRTRPSSEAPTRRAPSRVDARDSAAHHSTARGGNGNPSFGVAGEVGHTPSIRRSRHGHRSSIPTSHEPSTGSSTSSRRASHRKPRVDVVERSTARKSEKVALSVAQASSLEPVKNSCRTMVVYNGGDSRQSMFNALDLYQKIAVLKEVIRVEADQIRLDLEPNITEPRSIGVIEGLRQTIATYSMPHCCRSRRSQEVLRRVGEVRRTMERSSHVRKGAKLCLAVARPIVWYNDNVRGQLVAMACENVARPIWSITSAPFVLYKFRKNLQATLRQLDTADIPDDVREYQMNKVNFFLSQTRRMKSVKHMYHMIDRFFGLVLIERTLESSHNLFFGLYLETLHLKVEDDNYNIDHYRDKIEAHQKLYYSEGSALLTFYEGAMKACRKMFRAIDYRDNGVIRSGTLSRTLDGVGAALDLGCGRTDKLFEKLFSHLFGEVVLPSIRWSQAKSFELSAGKLVIGPLLDWATLSILGKLAPLAAPLTSRLAAFDQATVEINACRAAKGAKVLSAASLGYTFGPPAVSVMDQTTKVVTDSAARNIHKALLMAGATQHLRDAQQLVADSFNLSLVDVKQAFSVILTASAHTFTLVSLQQGQNLDVVNDLLDSPEELAELMSDQIQRINELFFIKKQGLKLFKAVGNWFSKEKGPPSEADYPEMPEYIPPIKRLPPKPILDSPDLPKRPTPTAKPVKGSLPLRAGWWGFISVKEAQKEINEEYETAWAEFSEKRAKERGELAQYKAEMTRYFGLIEEAKAKLTEDRRQWDDDIAKIEAEHAAAVDIAKAEHRAAVDSRQTEIDRMHAKYSQALALKEAVKHSRKAAKEQRKQHNAAKVITRAIRTRYWQLFAARAAASQLETSIRPAKTLKRHRLHLVQLKRLETEREHREKPGKLMLKTVAIFAAVQLGPMLINKAYDFFFRCTPYEEPTFEMDPSLMSGFWPNDECPIGTDPVSIWKAFTG